MNRRQRAIKRQLRRAENGRSSFKKVCLEGAKAFGYSDKFSDGLKMEQQRIKHERAKTRDYMSQIRSKEVLGI